MDNDEIGVAARAMEAKRRELIFHSLESIWPDLAKAALSASAEYRARVAQDCRGPCVTSEIARTKTDYPRPAQEKPADRGAAKSRSC
jgi:hypothetical protein